MRQIQHSIAITPQQSPLAMSAWPKLGMPGVSSLSGKELARLAHDGPVSAVAFSADGRLLATASEDNTARLFEAASGKKLARLAHDRGVNAVAFSPDGSVIMTASDDSTARLWRVWPNSQALVNDAKSRATHCLTPTQRKQYFLPKPPLHWCVERRLWPYDTDDWQSWLAKHKAWLSSGSQGPEPPLPKTACHVRRHGAGPDEPPDVACPLDSGADSTTIPDEGAADAR